MSIELNQFNKIYNKKFEYLIGKRFISNNPNLQKVQIKKIVEEIDTGKYEIYITKNMITYKKEFSSIMQLFDYYYNRGYVLEI